jgi:hypothetical protein
VIKKILLSVATLATLCFASDYTDGFARGFRLGERAGCGIPPIPAILPIPPIPPIGMDNWDGGFAIGYKKGLKINQCQQNY